jgi:flagellar biosynthesis component FlhA
MINCLNKILKKFDKNTTKITPEDRISEMYNSLSSDEIVILVGVDLTKTAPNFCSHIADLRENLFEKLGFILPPVRIVDSINVQENEYHFIINGNKAFVGFSLFNEVDAISEIMENFEITCLENIGEIFSNRMTEKYIEKVRDENSFLIWNLSNMLPVWSIKTILIDILKNGKSIKNISYILEKVCEILLEKSSYDIYEQNPNPHKISEKIIKSLSFDSF